MRSTIPSRWPTARTTVRPGSSTPQPDPGLRRRWREPPGSQSHLVRAGRLLGAGRRGCRRVHRSAVQIQEPDGLDLPERGLRSRFACRALGKPGAVPTGPGRRSGTSQVGNAGQRPNRSGGRHLPRRPPEPIRPPSQMLRRLPSRRSSISSDPSTASPSRPNRSARQGSAHRSPARCSPGWTGALTSRRQPPSAALRTAAPSPLTGSTTGCTRTPSRHHRARDL